MEHAARRLLAGALVLALALGFTPAPTSAQRVGDASFLVTASWLAQLGSDPSIVVVDTRPADAYTQGHIPGALNLPWQAVAQPNTDESEIGPWQARTTERLGSLGISPSDTVVSYDDNGNLFAARMRWVLKYLGHEHAVVLDGGVAAWMQLGRRLTIEPSTRPTTAYTGAPDPERLATWSYVLERLGDSGAQILDVRPRAAYTGEDPGTFRNAGHIPGALNLDWNANVLAEQPRTFKSLAELQASYDALGLDRNKEIIVYCVSGVASSNTLFVLDMLGYPKVRLYSGSWAEWGNRDDLPMTMGPEPGTPPI